MNDAERQARGHRAKSAMDEFVTPILADIKATYSQRIVDIANTELDARKRADKLTALSNGIRIAEAIESAMQAIILDGDIAVQNKLKAERIEKMTAPQRRLLGIVPA